MKISGKDFNGLLQNKILEWPILNEKISNPTNYQGN